MIRACAPSLCWLSEVLADMDRLSSPRSSKHRGEQSPSEPPHRPASSTSSPSSQNNRPARPVYQLKSHP